MTIPLRLYLGLTVIAPFVLTRMAARAHQRQKADPARLAERWGESSVPRPTGRLIWIHAASVGEVLAITDLAADLLRALPHARLLITTITATGGGMVASRAPEGTMHQFLPADTPAATTAFLDHWRPDLAIFTESDLWPRLVIEAARREVPLALVNVRPSRSRARMPRTVAALMGRFGCITTQSKTVQDGLVGLGLDAGRVVATGDLKADAVPLPYDAAGLADLMARIGTRRAWIAASTHADDEPPVLAAHRLAMAAIPDLLLIWIPRHPDRADAIMAQVGGLTVAQRSAGQSLAPDTAIYLADTLGETGLFYRAAPLVFLGGSFGDEGGHNPYEPAMLGAALLHGPNVRHFEAAFAGLRDAGAAREVASGEGLGTAMADLIQGSDLPAMQAAARAFMDGQSGVRARTLAPILALLPPND